MVWLTQRMIHRVSAIALVLVLLSCAKKECDDSPLTTALANTAILAETSLIDLGVAEHRPALRDGWSFDERWSDEATFVWGVGSKSTIRFNRFGTGSVRLRFRCATAPLPGAPEQRIHPRVNGADLPDVVLRSGTSFAVYQLDIPARALRPGPNLLEWHYATSGAPANSNDTRPLAVAWDWIEVVERGHEPRRQPVRIENSTFFLPIRSGLEFDVPIHPNQTLAIDRVELVGAKESMRGASVTFELTWNGDATSTSTRFEMREGFDDVRIPIPVDRVGTLHVRMFAPTLRLADGASGWRVVNPRLESCP